MDPEIEKQRTLTEWRELLADRLRKAAVPEEAIQAKIERLSDEAANNLNAMAEVNGAHILFDMFVKTLTRPR